LMLLPVKNRFASGSQTLTGQDNSDLTSLRCSTAVLSIARTPFNMVKS
jgi:hypothetical protein